MANVRMWASAATVLAASAAGVRAQEGWAEQAETITVKSLVTEMGTRDAITEFPTPAYRMMQASSYDRASTGADNQDTWYANADAGQFIRTEERNGRKEFVMMDARGPGAIVRMWSANPNGTLRIYLDDQETPVVEEKMEEFLLGKTYFGAPFAALQSRGYNMYGPIPYAQRCVVTSDAGDFYYQINYRTYEASAKVASFSAAEYADAAGVVEAARKALRDFPAPVGKGQEVNVFLTPGEERSLGYANGPAEITGISMKIVAGDIDAALRSTILIGEFDGQRTIEAPVGDFFGSAPGINEYQSWYAAVRPTGRMLSLWRMPYESRGELRIVNMGKDPVTVGASIFSDRIEWTDDSMHFHARWRAEYPIHSRPIRDWNYITVEGRGVYVGDALSVTNPIKTWWGEGDEKIYVDGEKFPSHFGTGTEDYYGYAWCDPTPFSSPFHNQPRCDGPGNFGYTSVNRYRLLDGIPFARGLKFDMEVWTHRESDVGYAVTTFFYARPGARTNAVSITPEMVQTIPPLPELTVFKFEGALEGEALKVLSTNPADLAYSVQDVDTEKTSKAQHLWVRGSKVQDGIDFEIPVTKPGKNRVSIALTKSWDYGIVQCQIRGQNAGPPIDLYSPEIDSTGLIDLGEFDLESKARLRIVLVGSNEASRDPKYYFGVDAVKVAPVEEK